jgi:hypothetical protein
MKLGNHTIFCPQGWHDPGLGVHPGHHEDGAYWQTYCLTDDAVSLKGVWMNKVWNDSRRRR